jgi:CDP-diacylglycerol--serine O-phosphatidyltransferase
MVLKRKDGPKKQSNLRTRLKTKFSERTAKVEPFTAIIPHIITTVAICCGLTSIRFALQNSWSEAIFAILLAAFLDGIDGRIARLLNTTSHFGAELDSFADLINFGVAPALVMYFASLHNLGNPGWAVVLFFAICMVMRLARFNVMALDESKLPIWGKQFFVGAPAPAAALLCLSPLIFGAAFNIQIPASITAMIMGCIGLLMVSHFPTMSLKKLPLKQHHTIPAVLLVVIILGALYSAPWVTLSIVILAYIFSMPIVYWQYRKFMSAQVSESKTLDSL